MTPFWKHEDRPDFRGSVAEEYGIYDYPPPPPPEETGEELKTKLGKLHCSARGCTEETGIDCAYIDRRERQCPTAWCPEHRLVVDNGVYCRQHGSIVAGTATDFTHHAVVDLDNRVPLLVNWVARELDADIRALIERLATEYQDNLVLEPVRFVLVGVERVRTWERSWKMCSHLSVDLRLTVAVEEKRPDVVSIRMNSKPLFEIAPPWNEDYPVGPEPASPQDAENSVREFHQRILSELTDAVQAWHANTPPETLQLPAPPETIPDIFDDIPPPPPLFPPEAPVN